MSNKKDTSSTGITQDILKTLLYFDVFNYPITIDEIYLFSHFSKDLIKNELNKLESLKIIFFNNGFYSISNSISTIKRRLKGNYRAKRFLKKSRFVSKFISQFPFVEAVFLSGSISKGYFGDKDDIDFFIVTSPKRVWVARTLLIAFNLSSI